MGSKGQLRMRHTGVLPGNPQLRLNRVSPGQFFTVPMQGSEDGEFVVLGRRQHSWVGGGSQQWVFEHITDPQLFQKHILPGLTPQQSHRRS